MIKRLPYLTAGILGLAIALGGCDKRDSEKPDSQETQNTKPYSQPSTENSRTITGWGKASQSDIDLAKNQVRRAKNNALQMKIDNIAGIYAGDKVTKIEGGYAVEREHNHTPYLNKVFEEADFNNDGDITLDEINRLEKLVLKTHSN